MKYRLRVDEVTDATLGKLLDICKDSAALVCVRHRLPHGNPHFHAYIEIDLKDTALRQRFKRTFPECKSSDYSIKKCDDDKVNEYVQYMFNRKHGNQWELCSVHNFNDQLLNDLQKNAEDVATDYASRAKSAKSKGPTIWDLAMEIENRFKTEYYTIDNLGDEIHSYYTNEERRITIYTDLAISVLRAHKKGFDEFLLRKVISTAMSSTEKGKEVLRKKMLKFFILN